MTKKELVIYVRQQLASGISPEVLKFVLSSDGWNEEDIEDVFAQAAKPVPAESPAKPPLRQSPAAVPRMPSAAFPEPAVSAAVSPVPATVVTTMPPMPSAGTAPVTLDHHGNRKWMIGGAAVLVIALAAAGYGAYAYYTASPGYVLNKTVENMAQVKTVEFSGVLTGEVSGGGPLGFGQTVKPVSVKDGKVAGLTTYKAEMRFNGRSDVTNLDDSRSEMTMQLDVQGKTVKINTRTAEGDLYLKAEQMPDIPGYDVNKLLGTWLKFDPSNLSALTEEIPDTAGSERGKIDEGKQERIRESLKEFQLFKLKNRSREDLAGIPTYKYEFEIDKDSLKQWLIKVNEIMETKDENFARVWDEEMAHLTFNNGEAWIGRRDNLIHKLKAGVSYRNDDTAVRLDLELNLGNYNQPFEITVPSSFKTFEQVMSEVTAETTEKARVRSRQARRIADVRQIQTALELYFNDQGKYPKQLSELSGSKTNYLFAIPTPPLPPETGCTETDNNYAYKQLQQGKSYSMTFCLGEENPYDPTENLFTASPEGIE